MAEPAEPLELLRAALANAPAVSGSCVGLAMVSGVVATFASLVITYPAHLASRREVPQSQTCRGLSFLANLSFSGASILLGISATGKGPVAVVFPLSVGSNLLSNMVLQLILGIAHYTKNMMTGTLVLATAVMILPDVGPSELPLGLNAVDILVQPASVAFIACSFASVVIGLGVILRGSVKDNTVLLFIYTVVNGNATVLSTSISKLVQMHLSLSVQVPMLIVYVLLGAFCLGMAAIANATLQDPSVFVPVGAGVNLVLTFTAGLCIWGDWARIDHRLSYILVYILVVLGTYSVSSFDFLSKETGQIEANRYVAAKRNMERSAICGPRGRAFVPQYDSQYEPRSSLRRRFDELLRLWATELTADPVDPNSLREALRDTLKLGLDREYISHGAIVELFIRLAEEPSLCPPRSYKSEELESWLRQKLKHRRRGSSTMDTMYSRDVSWEHIDRDLSIESGSSLEAALMPKPRRQESDRLPTTPSS